MDKKKVLHLIGGGEFGGAERHVLSLMRGADAASFTPMLACLCRGPFATMVDAAGFSAVTWPMKHKLDLAPRKQLREFILDQGISLVHTHGVRANYLARPLAAQMKLPVVTTFHSDLAYDYRRKAEYLFATVLTKIGNRYTDKFIAVSAAIAQGMVKMHIPAEKTVVIHNGIDAAAFDRQDTREELRHRYNLPAGARLVGTVARLHPVKGHVFLLQAAARLIPRYPDLYFMLIGDGSERSRLEAMAEDLGISSRVVFTGFLADVEKMYSAMDIFCLPSLMEGMGLSLVESMQCGTPVVASRVGGIPELVTDKVNGLLVEPGDSIALTNALEKLLEDPSLAENLAVAGRRTAGFFTIEAMAKKVEEVYRQLLH